MVIERIEPEKITELCNDYSKYLKIDISKNVISTAEVIEETLTRLEEFLSVMVMVQGECGEKQTESLLMRKQELYAMGDLIDRLQAMVAVVTQCVNEVESCVSNAEMDIDSRKGSLLSFFKPFFKKSEPVAYQHSSQLTFKPPEIFKTSDFFPEAKDN
ncbi:biogenesis of lysosome-related organelles complex 1 subunit 4 isoform X2 [Lycorma delicatula]|uniref:biogenesis of lysosome-related organelles complex 1 subunit 4 isoform X2 n=1 Tax=Lycorma delicatula TaxID=130591 RepID=UPI003F511A5A